MQQKKRSVNTSENSSRAVANVNSASGISKPAVIPFQKKVSPSFPEAQIPVTSHGPIVQRTLKDALEYYSRITKTKVKSEKDVDLDELSLGQRRWYLRKLRQSPEGGRRPHRKKKQPITIEPPKGRKRSRSESETVERPSKRKKKSGKTEQVGVVTWNLGHLGDGETNLAHNKKKVAEIVDMFEKNDWLDIMVLQEVNNIDFFEKLLKGNELRLLTGGPSMAVLRKTGGSGQSEVYPVIVREDSDWEVNRTDSFYPEGGEGIWVEDDNIEDVSSEEEEEETPWSAPELTKKEKKDYAGLTDEERKDELPEDWGNYLDELDDLYSTDEVDHNEDWDKGKEQEFVKLNKSHGEKDVWRDWSGNAELIELIDEGNSNLVDFIGKLNKYVVEKKEFREPQPDKKTKKGRNKDAYYRQLQKWINSVLIWLGDVEIKGYDAEDDIKRLEVHLDNVNMMLSIEDQENGTYRPIRRYTLNSQDKDVNLALNVVHTSPSDEGKSNNNKKRDTVFSQVSPVLKNMMERETTNEIMLGDVYINPDDLVEGGRKTEDVFEEMGVKIAGETRAATNRWSGRGLVTYNQADLIVVNDKTKVRSGGIVKRGTGGLEPSDKNHAETDKWTNAQGKQKAISDHAPVGAILDLKKGTNVNPSIEPTEEMIEEAKQKDFWQMLEEDKEKED